MILRLIYRMGTFTKSHALSYQIPSRLDSHFITRQESGVLCGHIKYPSQINLTSSKIASFESTLQVQTHSHLRRFMIPYELLNKAVGRGSTLQTMLSGIR